jgi:hypothetical protein
MKYKKVLQFNNGYGLSIICSEMSYGGNEGMFEIALLDSEGSIIYDDALGFSDVMGYLDFGHVALIIDKIRNATKE